jgi:hypothetical protein
LPLETKKKFSRSTWWQEFIWLFSVVFMFILCNFSSF